MTREEAEKYAENMTYREAIYNLKQAKSVPYRKATFIKINELIDELEQEPFMNKACVSGKVCEHDKKVVLDKIRAEIESIEHYGTNDGNDFWLRTPDEIKKDVLAILDKYKAESEGYENWVN